jgi:hypothetical protein
MADRTLMDFTRGVSSIIGSAGAPQSAPTAAAGVRSAYAPDSSATARIDDAFASIPGLAGASAVPGLAYAGSDAIVFKNPTVVDAAGRTVWARGFLRQPRPAG